MPASLRTLVVAISGLMAISAATAVSAAATAQPVKISVKGGIFDMVYDNRRGILYMTTGHPDVLRYRLSSQRFLKPLAIPGDLQGIDISADNNRLAIADFASSPDGISIDDYDLVADVNTIVSGEAVTGEVGTLDVAYHADGLVAVTGALPPGYSGWSSMHIADPHAGTLVPIGDIITNYSVVHPSSDHKAIGFTEGDISDGPWGIVQPSKLSFSIIEYTSCPTYEIAIAPRGAYFAIPTSGGTFVTDHDGNGIAILAKDAKNGFNGAVFDPVHAHLLYQSQVHTSEIQGWDIFTQKVVKTYETSVYILDAGGDLFPQGMLRISSDGTLLFMKTKSGAIALKIAP